MTKAQVTELAFKALRSGNPYIKGAVKFFIDKVPHFIYADSMISISELDKFYLETAEKDIRAGYKDRMVGYYDKWYRYNHADEGRAYDLGVKLALENPKCVEEMYIIECQA